MKIKDLRPKVKEFAYQRMREHMPDPIQQEDYTDDKRLSSFFPWHNNGQIEWVAWHDICYHSNYTLYPHLRED